MTDSAYSGMNPKRDPSPREQEERIQTRREGLKRYFLSKIREGGAIPFSEWMEGCLYHPEWGYYQTREIRTGKRGDYYTGPCVHPLFGFLIARQLRQMSEILGGERFDIVEMGGGGGALCKDILRWARERDSFFYQKIRYVLIERSSSMAQAQRESLAEGHEERKITWMDPSVFPSGKNSFQGCFLSNELVDAFPVHRVIWQGGRLKELYVDYRKDRFVEIWGEPSDPGIDSYFPWIRTTLQEGQQAEVNLEALRWMEIVDRCLEKGFCLTVDYGDLADGLYTPFRWEGTVRCYRRHQVSGNFYESWGEQDLTAHVNFTALIQKGEELGLKTTGFVPQYRFLMALGFFEEMEALEHPLTEGDRLRLRLSLKHLIEPEVGMGEAFKVLIQHKGVDDPNLDGLRPL